jgi:hypothetical protein
VSWPDPCRRALILTTNVLTTATLVYACGVGITAGAGTDTFPLLAFFEIFNLLPFEDIIGKYLPSLIFSFATSTCCNWVIYEPAASRESIRRLSGVFYEIEHPFLVPIKALFGLYPNNDS